MFTAFANDYSGLYNNVLGTQQQDASNWFRMAELARQQQEQQLQVANQARAIQQAQFTAGLHQQAEERADRSERFNEATDTAKLGLSREQMNWRNETPTTADERRSELLFKSGLELADTGELTPSDLKGLPESHRSFLTAHNERARKALVGQQSDLDKAAETLNREIQLENMVGQGMKDLPGPLTFAFQPKKFSRMSEDVTNWREQLPDVKRSAAAIRSKADLMAHLRLNEDGWWEPSLRLPWMPTGQSPVIDVGAQQLPKPTVSSPQLQTRKALTREVAMDLLNQAGGDKERARAMARQAGYDF